MRKRAFAAIFAACLGLAAAEGRSTVRFRTEYASPGGLDPSYYSFEDPFVEFLPSCRIMPGEAEGSVIELRILCDPIAPIVFKGATYQIYNATVRIKVLVLAPDGALRFSGELAPAKGAGPDPKAAEIKALANARKPLRAFVEAEAGRLAQALAE